MLERGRGSSPGWHAAQRALAGLSTRGVLARADGSGHVIQEERPDLVVEAIRQVLAQVGTVERLA